MGLFEEVYQKYKNHEINIIEYFSRLQANREENVDDYAVYINKIAQENIFIDSFESILGDTSKKCIWICAFYALCIRYRRDKDFTKFKNLLDKYKVQFKSDNIYMMQRIVYTKSVKSSTTDIILALNLWKNIRDNYKKAPAYIQAYADLVATAFEDGVITKDKTEFSNLLKDIISQLEESLVEREHPKIYATLGRLYAFTNEYDKAISSINKAIDIEDSTLRDYSIRIGDYQSIIAKINIKKYYDHEMEKLLELKNEVQMIKSEVEKSKIENISFLGFFTALLSLIIGSIQIAQNTTAQQIIVIILVLCSGLVNVFGAFNLMLFSDKKRIFISLIMILIGMLGVYFSITHVPALFSIEVKLW